MRKNDGDVACASCKTQPGDFHDPYCGAADVYLVATEGVPERQAAQKPTMSADALELAAETLQALGWSFVGNCWVQDSVHDLKTAAHTTHPLCAVFHAAINQAMYGKGERHGGAVTPFLEQPWVHLARMHGRGFLTGQAAKKLEEAASKRSGEAFVTEVLGAMVYAGMAVLWEKGEVE